jgi:hypothetical protein
MAKQTRSQKIGSRGHNFVSELISDSDFWIARNMNEDFGIDLEMELSVGEVSGRFIKVQVKSHQSVKQEGDFVEERLDKDFLRYVYECRVPIILVVVSTGEKIAWYVWLQKWLIDTKNFVNIYDKTSTQSLAISINVNNTLKVGLNKDLISIATWENATQLYISIKDLANLSLRLYDSTLSQLLFDYLKRYKTLNEYSYLDSLIEEVINLGSGIWATDQGSKVSQFLLQFVRENGDQFNANHIAKLVVRGGQCSRTGINALGILYDVFPKHTKSLALVERFQDFADPRLHYYCSIRERYLGMTSPEWLFTEDLVVNNIRFTLERNEILNKWANRGDSIVFDYTQFISDASDLSPMEESD